MIPNVYLTKEDYQNLVSILDNVEVKGRKSAEYIAILGLKLDNRVRTWFEGHPSGLDIIEVAKTSEAYEAAIKSGVKASLAARDIANREETVVAPPAPLKAEYEQDT